MSRRIRIRFTAVLLTGPGGLTAQHTAAKVTCQGRGRVRTQALGTEVTTALAERPPSCIGDVTLVLLVQVRKDVFLMQCTPNVFVVLSSIGK